MVHEDGCELLKSLLYFVALTAFIDPKSDVRELGFCLADGSVDFFGDIAL